MHYIWCTELFCNLVSCSGNCPSLSPVFSRFNLREKTSLKLKCMLLNQGYGLRGVPRVLTIKSCVSSTDLKYMYMKKVSFSSCLIRQYLFTCGTWVPLERSPDNDFINTFIQCRPYSYNRSQEGLMLSKNKKC